MSQFFDCLHESSIVREVDVSNVVVIPVQNRLTHQILSHQILNMCQPFKDLKQTFVVYRRTEHHRFCEQYCVVTTVEDSILLKEM